MSAEVGHHHSHAKKYWIVFAALAIMTGLELWAAEGGFSYVVKASSLTFLALAKAFAVAFWFMHLEDEKGWLKFIAAIPLSAGVYAAVVILESLYR